MYAYLIAVRKRVKRTNKNLQSTATVLCVQYQYVYPESYNVSETNLSILFFLLSSVSSSSSIFIDKSIYVHVIIQNSTGPQFCAGFVETEHQDFITASTLAKDAKDFSEEAFNKKFNIVHVLRISNVQF